ncbi:hypothetical protein [Streptomyces sp. NBC_01353]|uniref:hypothetical protein n=1 Tax=Streptomyces sp. NBC_01353 TaxID=2903835 RepID=UPI002E307832|nr:hypothetical protein [Streptomyces sp. NBC_01353]
MGREVRRVPLDFDWPLNKVWDGYLMPDRFTETPCADCKNGYSPHAQNLHDLWYGYLPFNPESTGSTPLRPDTPTVRALAEQHITTAPEFYGTGETAIVCEAQRIAELFNGLWCHHLSQDDVDALVAAGRLYSFTHTWNREHGWQKIEPPVVPTAAQVNEWSLRGMGHDGINASVAVQARCEREGFPLECPSCHGYGSAEAYAGQRAEAEAWEPTEPPTGDGWQLWTTANEGAPISPVFASADELASWMSDPARGTAWVPPATAAAFIADGWAPSFVSTAETGVVSGVEWMGHHTTSGDAGDDA